MTPKECMKKAEEIGVAAVLQSFGGTARVRLPMSDSFLALSVDELPLSVRARNALMRSSLNTIGKLVDYIRENGSMSHIRNLGKKSIYEVKMVLSEAAYNHLTEQEKLAFWMFACPVLQQKESGANNEKAADL